MKKYEPRLDTIISEIRYASGHLYFDRCGQCLIDIESECDGWLAGGVDVNSGVLEQPEKQFRIGFNNKKFDFTASKVENQNFDLVAKEMATIWKIIQTNLGLTDLLRVGCRLFYLVATKSVEEAEKLLEKSELNIIIPFEIKDHGYRVKIRELTTILSRNDLEYRVKLGTVTRTEAIDPSTLISGDPRALSENQQKFRLAQLQRLSEYSRNPMYALSLDIDCVQFHPKNLSIEKFILEQAEVVKDHFLPILEKLCNH